MPIEWNGNPDKNLLVLLEKRDYVILFLNIKNYKKKTRLFIIKLYVFLYNNIK